MNKKVLLFLLLSSFCLTGCDYNFYYADVPTEGGEHEDYVDPDKDKEEEEPEEIEIPYEEPLDSLDGVDASDLSELYSAFNDVNSYKVNYYSYFNKRALELYYNNYSKNYIQDKIGLFTEDSCYLYTEMSDYFTLLNDGLVNYNSNLYSFSLSGETIEERLSSSLVEEGLTPVKENDTYQNSSFTLAKLTEEYLTSSEFTRISANKYQTTKFDSLADFMELTSPGMINRGYYMTFAKATIELNVSEDIAYRIRLYTPSTQIGKLVTSHTDSENKPNWYLLFSEMCISKVNETSFSPAESLNTLEA